MPVIPKTTGPTPYAAAAVEFLWTASTPAGDTVALTGREILLVWNSGATPRTFTVNSQPDPYGREADIVAQSLAAGEFAVLGPIPLTGWANSTKQLELLSSHAEIKYAVITLAGG